MSPKRKPKANVQEILNNPVRSTKQKGVKPKREGFLGWMTYLGWSMTVWTILPIKLTELRDYVAYFPFPFEFVLVICGIAMLLFSKIWLNSSYRQSISFIERTQLSVIISWFKSYRQSISFIERTLLAGVTVFILVLSIYVVFFGFHAEFERILFGGIGGKEGIRFLICYSWLLSVVIFRMMIKIRWAQFFKLYGIGVILSFVFVLDTIWNERYYGRVPYAFFEYYSIYWIYAIGAYLYIFYKKSKDGYNKVWLKVFLFTLLPFLYLFSVRFEPKAAEIMPSMAMGDVLYEL